MLVKFGIVVGPASKADFKILTLLKSLLELSSFVLKRNSKFTKLFGSGSSFLFSRNGGSLVFIQTRLDLSKLFDDLLSIGFFDRKIIMSLLEIECY